MKDHPIETRDEFAEWDPFASDLSPVNAVATAVADAELADVARRFPKKYKRAPSRDFSRELEKCIAARAQRLAKLNSRNEWVLSEKARAGVANEFNLKADFVLSLWRRDDVDAITPDVLAEREQACAAELAAIRRLAPLRHLIALVHKPHEADDGELETAAAGLGAMIPPELRTLLHDLAFILELAAQIQMRRESALERLFAYYETRVDAEPTINTLVVNWCRDTKVTEAIYPPCVGRFRNDEEPE